MAIFVAGLPEMVIAQGKTGPSAIETINVLEVTYSSEKSFVGSLYPIQSAVIGTAVEGRVVEVFVKAGDSVGAETGVQLPDTQRKSDGHAEFAGVPMMRLRTRTLEIEIKLAEINAQLSQQALNELTLSIPADIKVAESEKKQASSQFSYAKTDYEMSQRLRKQSGAVSELELQLARSQFLAAENAVTSADLLLEKLNATKDVRIAQAQLQADVAQQELVRLQDLLSKYTIRAPFEGVVTEKLTEVGAWLTRGADVAKIVRLDRIEMVINVPQEYVGQLQTTLGKEVNVRFDGVDQLIVGKVERIVPQIDLRSRSFPVRLMIENPKVDDVNYLLQPGMLGLATMAVGEPKPMVLVKKDCLVLDGGRSTVFKINSKTSPPTVQAVNVQTGISVGQWIQVKGDVNKDDDVVLLGNERLRDGQGVKIIKKRIESFDDAAGS